MKTIQPLSFVFILDKWTPVWLEPSPLFHSVFPVQMKYGLIQIWSHRLKDGRLLQILKSFAYKDILDKSMLPLLWEPVPERSFPFQHDWAPEKNAGP